MHSFNYYTNQKQITKFSIYTEEHARKSSHLLKWLDFFAFFRIFWCCTISKLPVWKMGPTLCIFAILGFYIVQKYSKNEDRSFERLPKFRFPNEHALKLWYKTPKTTFKNNFQNFVHSIKLKFWKLWWLE